MRQFKIYCTAFYLFLLSCSFVLPAFSQKLKVYDLTCEYQNNPLGIDVVNPRLSWKLQSSDKNILQKAYEIRVANTAEATEKGEALLWKTGKVNSDKSIHIQYEGPALQSRQKCFWQVRVWDNQGNVSPWSEIKSWEMGLLSADAWSAKWIRGERKIAEDGKRPASLLRKGFRLKSPVKAARLYITAHGIYEAEFNGKRVGDSYLSPGWTSYRKRLQYQVYDVTDLVKQGENAAGVSIGSGWYASYMPFSDRKTNLYGDDLSLLFQLEVQYEDGTKDLVTSDSSWKTTSDGPVRASEIYDGEIYDARMEKSGWSSAGFSDSSWKMVTVTDFDKNNLVAMSGPPVRKQETFKALKIFKTPKGETVVDFGQNLVGWVQLKVSGKPGETITIHHAEVLDKAGNFYTDNLRSAKQEIKYTLKGGKPEVYEPHFTFQGFRYIKIDGFPGEPKPENFTAIAVYSDMKPAGTFSSSNALLNQLQHNIQWGQNGNFVDVPTDCPQRDERLGWTGDAQAFFRTATFNRNVAGFFSKWLQDVKADQHENGSIPWVIPQAFDGDGSAGWADAATIIPWQYYKAYGDKRVLEQQYESMKNWVNYIRQKSPEDLWNTGFHFGDWLFYRPDDDNDGRAALTDKYLIAQCFYAHSTQLLINAAKVLDKKEDVQTYNGLLNRIKKAFVNEYLTPNGRLVSGSQTAYVLALNFDMLPEGLRAQAAERLVKNVKDYNHLTTGFLGTPYLCQVLSRFGYRDVAYSLLLRESYPSWLYPVKMGATTIWERWDGQKPDGTFQTPNMNSFNHYAYGAIGDWMYREIAGIREDEEVPGYKKIIIAPHPGGSLSNASAEYETLYGTVKSAWDIKDGKFILNITVPANTTAGVHLPGASSAKVAIDGKDISTAKTINNVSKNADELQFTVGSGSYQIEYNRK
ncbi:family 78 glycoside hydrolase catalytic domain [Rubrolithibacter danxiaensis]|uniref:family 78 glycoside hydrolase catalytic domain n=1 Tax=Rubrolithibacter danxiaensis TaxID=3390805 RepID=UPI003BF79E4F